MLHFLTMADNRGPLRRYLRWWGGSLHGRARLIPYDTIRDPGTLRDGTYVFCDLERLPLVDLAGVEAIFMSLAGRGDAVRLLNRPSRVLRRRELLRLLNQRGINRFNVYSLDDPRAGLRYPVFVRNTREHTGPLSSLLFDQAALDQAIAATIAGGCDPGDLLIVEFLDTRETSGYRKYSVLKVGSQLVAQHIFFDDTWVVKATTKWPSERVLADNEFMLANPHAAIVNQVFDLAGIDFGRIDYAMLDGKIQVWEINTVPTILLQKSYYGPDRLPAKRAFADRFNAALAALDAHSRPSGLLERARSYQDIFLKKHKFE